LRNRLTDEALNNASQKVEDANSEDLFSIDVKGFEGPLHLLLELSRKQRVDLLEVSILELANQFLDFIMEARYRRIDLAADYLLMASWLAYLKSKLLLPKLEKETSDEADPDGMARRLAFRLKRLEAMREASADLQALDITGRDCFVRGAPEQSKITRRVIYDVSMFDLMQAFGKIQTRKTKVRSHVVKRQPVFALEEARKSLKKMAPKLVDWSSIKSLPPPDSDDDQTSQKSVTASYFAAALELTRDRAVDIRQDRPLADVYVKQAGNTERPQAAE